MTNTMTNNIKGAKECQIKKGENGNAVLDHCIDGEYFDQEKLSETKGYTKKVTNADKTGFEQVCQRVDPLFQEGDDSCITQSVNKLETKDRAEKTTKQGVTGYKFEEPSEIKTIEEVQDIHM